MFYKGAKEQLGCSSGLEQFDSWCVSAAAMRSFALLAGLHVRFQCNCHSAQSGDPN